MVNEMKEINIENLKDLKNIEEYLNSNYIINSMNIKKQNLFNYNADELEFSYSYFYNSNILNCNLEKLYINNCTFKNCNLSNSILHKSTLKNVIFENCNLVGVNLSNSSVMLQ